MTLRTKRAIAGYTFILPFILGFVLFMSWPLIQSLVMSFCEVSPQKFTMEWVSLTNYDYVLNFIPWFRTTIIGESYRIIINTVATLVFSFVVAVVLNGKFSGRTLARAIFFLPVLFSSGVLLGLDSNMINIKSSNTLMAGMNVAIAEAGNVNLTASLQELLQTTGFATEAFQIVFDIIEGIYDVAIASGIQIIVFLSGMQSISPSLYEAANVEGCSAWESFWMITFPAISPLLLVNLIYTVVDFSTRSNNVVMEKVIQMMYNEYNFGAASAIAWLYMAIITVLIAVGAFIITRGVKSLE